MALLIQNASVFYTCGKKIIRTQILSELAWCLYYAMLGLTNVVVICIGAILRNCFSCHLPRRKLRFFNFGYSLILCSVLLIMLSNAIDALPIIAAIMIYFRMTSRDNLIPFHIYGIIIALLWSTFAVYSGAWLALFGDVLALVCGSIALYKTIYREKASISSLLPA